MSGSATVDSSAVGFIIRHPKLRLRISMVPISDLRVHELTVPSQVRAVRDSILAESILYDPCIVDEYTMLVLDGVHRVAALRELDCVRVPVCFVNYYEDSIRVGTWYRVITGEGAYGAAADYIRSMGRSVTLRDRNRITSLREVRLALVDSNLSFIIPETQDLRDAYELLSKLEGELERRGFAISYHTEADALRKLERKEANAAITAPVLTKDDVLNFVRTNALPGHKITRHIIPARPLKVDIPLSVLRDNALSLSEANDRLKDSLKKRVLKLNPSGSVIMGRRYEEETYVFS